MRFPEWYGGIPDGKIDFLIKLVRIPGLSVDEARG